MNHTRFPKEDHPPEWARRDDQVKKGDGVQRSLHGVYNKGCYLRSSIHHSSYQSFQLLITYESKMCYNLFPSL